MVCELQRAIEWDKLAGNKPLASPADNMFTSYYALSLDLIKEEYHELLDADDELDLTGVVDAIGDMLKVVSQLAYSLNLNPALILEAVNDSNYSKFDKTEEDAIISVQSYKDDGRYKNVFYEEINGLFVIKGWKVNAEPSSKPKVLKSHKYVEPNWSEVLNNKATGE